MCGQAMKEPKSGNAAAKDRDINFGWLLHKIFRSELPTEDMGKNQRDDNRRV
jgi:hypothetical protein